MTAEGQKDVDAATRLGLVDGVHVVASVVDEHVCKVGEERRIMNKTVVVVVIVQLK